MIYDAPWGESPSKYMARRAISIAIKKKQIKRPKKCSTCGAKPGSDSQGNPQVQAIHLQGYAVENRLNVVWLCISCRNKAVWARKRERLQEAARA